MDLHSFCNSHMFASVRTWAYYTEIFVLPLYANAPAQRSAALGWSRRVKSPPSTRNSILNIRRPSHWLYGNVNQCNWCCAHWPALAGQSDRKFSEALSVWLRSLTVENGNFRAFPLRLQLYAEFFHNSGKWICLKRFQTESLAMAKHEEWRNFLLMNLLVYLFVKIYYLVYAKILRRWDTNSCIVRNNFYQDNECVR